MKHLFIMKVGTTFPNTLKQFGDFDAWTKDALGETELDIQIVDAEHGEPLPDIGDCAGVAVTGSHDMVTDNLPWSAAMETWIRGLLNAGAPFFGICYGHQLLAKAAGGKVGFHPGGKEIGTVSVYKLAEAENDPIFENLPGTFLAHTTHAQTVLELPPDAVCLAANDFEPHHAFRVGNAAWGVQFHPEYSAAIMTSYIEEQAEELAKAGREIRPILNTVRETPEAASVARQFVRIVERNLK